MESQVEHEVCGNCKKEIPNHNYVMHTVHCARNFTFCPKCKEPIPKAQFEDHKKSHDTSTSKSPAKPKPPPLDVEKSEYFRRQREIEEKKAADRKERYLERHERFVEKGNVVGRAEVQKTSVVNGTDGNRKKPQPDLLACKYCELELPKLDLVEHENYCGARTDKCGECGELVMFKYKKLHEETNHGFLKLKDEPGPKPSWESSTPLSQTATRRRRLSPLNSFTSGFDLPPMPIPQPTEKRETYREISRRLDCKTEYIRNLLHDSASITVPLRSNGAVPRNHFNHNKGPAPQPPRRNPPTTLELPCEFCGVPVPHEDLIQHETGCRPDLARLNPRRRRSPSPEEFFAAAAAIAAPSSPEVELPCEFCADMFPASQLLRHQATCV